MKVTHIRQLLLLFILLIFFSACGETSDPYPDENNKKDDDIEIIDESVESDDAISDHDSDEPGGLGDPCKTAQDCQMQYKCVENICVEDGETTDKDTTPDKEADEDAFLDEDGDVVDTTPDEDAVDTLPDEDFVDIDPDIDETVDADSDREIPDWDGTTICGNGVVEPGEKCDDKNAVNDDYCANDCWTINGFCGDGIKQKYELCDDGNADDGDYCSADCKEITGACGDTELQTNEVCEDGGNNGKYGYCSLICDGPGVGCGDGVLQGNRERCDDGNTFNGDYCSSNCQVIIGACGDGTLQSNEACDDYNHDDGDYCSADCQTITGRCGDNIKLSFEECDDGNNFSEKCDYGESGGCTICNAICIFESGTLTYCGDSIIDLDNGEVCDDGAENGNPNKCGADCTIYTAICGDNNIDAGETCDDGEDNGTYGSCSPQCDGPARCGDGFKDPAHEVCDDGNTVGGDHCSADCTAETGYCGDSSLQSGEECDDGNDIDDDYCTNSCEDNGNCGDGTPQSNELCDDGVDNGSYGHCNTTCDGNGPFCGDGILNNPPEVCDGTSDLCFDYGSQYMDGWALCKSDCTGIDISSCDIFKTSLLPGSGLTACYNTTAEITCPTPSESFYSQDANFTHNPLTATTIETLGGDRVVTLDSTGIMWQGTLSATAYTASGATAYCTGLSYAGFSDWKVPDIEWFVNLLVDYDNAPHIVPDLASSSESTTYWAATQQGSNQWIYNLADATTSLDLTTATHKVQCARNIPTDSFYDTIFFSMTDVHGDLYYSEMHSGLDWSPPLTKSASWDKALSYCMTYFYTEFTDWRLPTEVELLILANTNRYNPASIFPEISSVSYWSATTSVEDNEKAFVVDMMDGSTESVIKTDLLPFYCVRAR